MGLGVAVLVTVAAGRMSVMRTVAVAYLENAGGLGSAPMVPPTRTQSVWTSPASPLEVAVNEHVDVLSALMFRGTLQVVLVMLPWTVVRSP